MIQTPTFKNKAELFDWLIENKSALIAQKKSAIKEADAISFQAPIINDKGGVCKSESEIPATATKIKVRSIINTTKIMDSHSDVHIDQIWNKSLKENKENYLCNQHNFSFEGIISDNVKAFVKQMTWKELGFDFEGNTQALVFDSVIDKSDNPMMFDKYRQGKVKNHSVGMRYVSLKMAINDDRYENEKATWDKYIDMVANKEDAEVQGYFWAVTEAKVIEGSPVVKGSNYATPTQRVEETKTDAVIDTAEKIEPAAATHKESIFSNLKLLK